MKVDPTNTAIQIDAYMRQSHPSQKAVEGQTKSGQPATKTDEVQLSQTAVETQRAAQLSKQTSEIREDKVRDIKLEVESGHYHVPAEKIAGNMLNEGFENNLLLNKIDTQA